MHGKKFLVKEARFGTDGSDFYLRVDFHPGYEQELSAMEARVTFEPVNQPRSSYLALNFSHIGAMASEVRFADPPSVTVDGLIECAFGRILEARIPLKPLGVTGGNGLRFQFSLWEGGLPIDAVPQQGWLEIHSTDLDELAG